jgi:Tol biopolymer transport system component
VKGILTALLLGPLAALATLAGVLLTDRTSLAAQDVAPYTGSLLYLNNGDVWKLDLATEDRSRVLDIGPGIITHVAHSPDRLHLAIAVLNLDTTYRGVGSEIVTTNVDGSAPRVVAHDETGRISLSAPAWMPDGRRLLVVTTRLEDGRRQIEELDVESGARSVLVDDGSSPSASPDGRWVTFDRQIGRAWSIWGIDRSTGAQNEIVPPTWFDDADVPSFAPDSRTIAFAAAGAGPAEMAPVARLGGLHAALQPTAHAHDLPGALLDLWAVQQDGTGLRRIAALFSMQPALAWSPSGQHVAVWSSVGLQIVDVNTGSWRLLTAPGASGATSWGF